MWICCAKKREQKSWNTPQDCCKCLEAHCYPSTGPIWFAGEVCTKTCSPHSTTSRIGSKLDSWFRPTGEFCKPISPGRKPSHPTLRKQSLPHIWGCERANVLTCFDWKQGILRTSISAHHHKAPSFIICLSDPILHQSHSLLPKTASKEFYVLIMEAFMHAIGHVRMK